MKRCVKSWLALMVVLGLAGCGQIPVSTDYDPAWRLAPGASYGWVQPKEKGESDPLYDNDLVESRVQRAVDERLAAHGLQRATGAGEPTLLVAYHIGREEKIDIDTFHSWYGYYPCWGCWGPRYGYAPGFGHGHGYGSGTDIWVQEYTEDRLIIDLIDAQSRRLVWRGVAERRLPSMETPGEREAYIRETVSAIFEEFPPGVDGPR